MKIILLFTALLFCASVSAQELPESPKPKINRKVFVIGASALAAAKTFDAVSTQNLLNHGGWEAASPELGKHPSSLRLAGVAASDFAWQSTIFYFTERNRHAWVRWSGRAFIGFVVEQHLRLGSCNLRINTHSSTVQTCH